MLVASKPGALRRTRRSGNRPPCARAASVYSNEDVVSQFNRNGFAYFRQISLVLSTLTMVFAFLLVATLLTVSINQRLGEIAALRALGIGRTRIASMLLWESALLVGAGRPARAAARRRAGPRARSHPPPDARHPRADALFRLRAARDRRTSRSGRHRVVPPRHLSCTAGCHAAHRSDAEARGARLMALVEARDVSRIFPMPAGPVGRCGTCRWRSRPASTSRSQGRPAAASRRCCIFSAASTRRRAESCVSTDATSRIVGSRAHAHAADAHRLRVPAVLPAADADRVGKHRAAAGRGPEPGPGAH